MKRGHLLTLLLSIVLLFSFSCKEESFDPELLDDDVIYRDDRINTEVRFTFNGEEYFTEDFFPYPFQQRYRFIYYRNSYWYFILSYNIPVFVERNGERILAGKVLSYLTYLNDYDGENKETFQYKSLKTGEDNIEAYFKLDLIDSTGWDGGGIYYYDPQVIESGGGYRLEEVQNISVISTPSSVYESASFSIDFGKISKKEISASFNAELFNRGNNEDNNVYTANGTVKIRTINTSGDSREVEDDSDDDNSGVGCSDLTYNGPQAGQVKQWCQYAQFLGCMGLYTEKQVQCTILEDFGASCPYC